VLQFASVAFGVIEIKSIAEITAGRTKHYRNIDAAFCNCFAQPKKHYFASKF
jgi:hypothetical protein